VVERNAETVPVHIRNHIRDLWIPHLFSSSPRRRPIDSHLNDKAYFVPGLGDFGDRMYGMK